MLWTTSKLFSEKDDGYLINQFWYWPSKPELYISMLDAN